MPFYVADYLADTGHLTTLEHGAYMLLIMTYWRKGGLPDDDGQLARITRMPAEEWLNVRSTLVQLFQNGWKHKRIDEELAKSAEKVNLSKLAGKRSGEARKANGRSTPVQRTLNGGSAGVPTEPQPSQPQPQPQEPNLTAKRLEPERAALAEFKTGIVDAFQAARSMTQNPDTSRAEIWVSQGFKPDICLAVIRECLARKPNVAALKYFDSAIAEAHSEPRARGSPPRRMNGKDSLLQVIGEAMEKANERDRSGDFEKTIDGTYSAQPES